MTTTKKTKMASVALLGGSFNPPHLAHQFICLWALSTGRAEQVWLLPTERHAFHKKLLPFEHRLQMCQLALEAFAADRVAVCAIEREMGGEGRTLFTLRRLIADYPEHSFSLLIGADILRDRHSWYCFDEIERLVPLHVVGRSGYAGPPDAVQLPAISSTDIRQRLATGAPVDHLVPASVLAYIREHALYGPESESEQQSDG